MESRALTSGLLDSSSDSLPPSIGKPEKTVGEYSAILHSWVLSHPSGPELQSSLLNCAAVRSDVEHQYGHEVGSAGRVEIQEFFLQSQPDKWRGDKF